MATSSKMISKNITTQKNKFPGSNVPLLFCLRGMARTDYILKSGGFSFVFEYDCSNHVGRKKPCMHNFPRLTHIDR